MFFMAVATMIFLVSTSYACSSANGDVGTVPTDSPLWSFTAVVGLAFSVRDWSGMIQPPDAHKC